MLFSTPSFSPKGPITQKLIFWCRPEAVLMLIYNPFPAEYTGHSLVRAIVQTPEYELHRGYRIPYEQIRCP